MHSLHIQVWLDQVADEFGYALVLEVGQQFKLVVFLGCKFQVWLDPDRSLSSLRGFCVFQNGFREKLTYTDFIFQAVFHNLVVLRQGDVGLKEAQARRFSTLTKFAALIWAGYRFVRKTQYSVLNPES